jgi:hypothetical protein
MEDWYSVTDVDIQDAGGGPLLEEHGTILNLLEQEYPNYNWYAEATSFVISNLF